MDDDQKKYLRYNRYLMRSIGQWPDQNILEKIVVDILFVPIVAAQLILQGGGLLYAVVDMDAFMEGVAPFIISLMCLAKYINYTYNLNQMRELLETMKKDWTFFGRQKCERDILCHYYKIGKKTTFGYAVSLYGSMTPFMVVPALVNAASAMGFMNATNDKPLMFRVDYFVDADTYYYPILLHSYFGTIAYIAIVVAIDGMNIFHVQHGCALCEILGCRLQRIVEDDDLDIDVNPSIYDDKAHENMKDCIELHNHIINFTNKLEDTNTISYFFQLGLNMLGITFTEFQAAIKLNTPAVALRYACFTVCLTFVLFLESWPGQQLENHSERLREYAFDLIPEKRQPFSTRGKWYQASIAARKDINVMLMRCLIPMKLTAGKVYILNMQSFSTVVRTSFSYFTVLSSMQ